MKTSMQRRIYSVTGMHCESCQTIIENKFFTMPGIKLVDASSAKGEVTVEYEGVVPSIQEINQSFKDSGYNYVFSEKQTEPTQNSQPATVNQNKPAEQLLNTKPVQEHTYLVDGMHCASCEILIENKILALPGVKSVEASTSKGEVTIEYQEAKPNVVELDKLFKNEGYSFHEKSKDNVYKQKKREIEAEKKVEGGGFGSSILIAVVLILAFLGINKLGLDSLINVTSGSSLPAFFAFGLLAGVSSCAALVGGLILSMSKQWSELYADQSAGKKSEPHVLFNLGRVISYLFFGTILGLIGSRFQLSLPFTSFLIIAISVLMFGISMQMLGVKAFRKFQIAMPKSLTRYVANEKNFQGKNMPFFMGALTFFLPCGFTLTAQGLALLSGNPLQGGLIMMFFALGTAIPLLLIGLSSIAFSTKPHWSARFSKIAGVIILFFALFNINAQFIVLGYGSFGDLFSSSPSVTQSTDKDLAPIVAGKQVIEMTASGSKDSPNYFKVRVGIPVQWKITAAQSTGCNNGIIANGLIEGQIQLTPGGTIVKEFTPTKTGRYRFSCSMGMISGVIEVVDAPLSQSRIPTVSAATNDVNNATDNSGLPAIIDGKQLIKMTAQAGKDDPNYIKVKLGVPVRWEITAGSSLGCNNAIISNSLFDGSISLTPGQVSVKEFTPTKAGKYTFSCSMGMISGIIEVVDSNSTASATTASNDTAVPSGARGCGCGGGGSSGTCGGR